MNRDQRLPSVAMALRWIPRAAFGVASLTLLTAAGVRVDRTVEAAGEVRFESYQVVRPSVPGSVAEVFVEPGDTVRPGTLLARLEDPVTGQELARSRREALNVQRRLEESQKDLQLLRQEIHPLTMNLAMRKHQQDHLEERSARAEIEEATLVLEASKRRLAREKALADAGLLSQVSLEEAQFDLLSQQQRVEQRQLREQARDLQRDARQEELTLLRLEHQQARQTLRGEIAQLRTESSTISERIAELTQKIELGNLISLLQGVVVGEPAMDLRGRYLAPGDLLTTIVEVGSIHFQCLVPENAIVRVQTGQEVRVEVSGLPKRNFRSFIGIVENVGQIPVSEPNGRVRFPVHIALRKPWVDLESGRFYLRSGMQGQAQIAYHGSTNLIGAVIENLLGSRS